MSTFTMNLIQIFIVKIVCEGMKRLVMCINRLCMFMFVSYNLTKKCKYSGDEIPVHICIGSNVNFPLMVFYNER